MMKSALITIIKHGQMLAAAIMVLLVLLAFPLLAKSSAGEVNPTSAFTTLSTPCETYLVFASGPSSNHQSVHISGSNAGSGVQLAGGGIYGGDGGLIQNAQMGGDPIPSVNLVGGCTGKCSIQGTFNPNFDAQPQRMPLGYYMNDFEPGGQYAWATGWSPSCSAPNGCGNYHYYDGDFNPPANTILSGLYYVNGDVNLDDVSGHASIVASGKILVQRQTQLTTFSWLFPLFFTSSDNLTMGAIHASHLALDLQGVLFAPNGAINFSGASGQVDGFVYGREVHLTASRVSISWNALSQPDRAVQSSASQCPYTSR